ncbi:ser Thr protein phosphatase [Rhizoctonia solani]|uniref:Ser Thr protein phosphatase n=1 Tax=Rhizoctonia solani TaxID=456999 RepID=A0A8H7LQ44_9AGAM|nr:ser Thr protein phosphatase [Rhizoctonia solani]
MKLQIMSDAHMQIDCGFGREYGKFDFPAVAPNLVLLGGMGRICDVELQDFIVLQLTRFENVFYVMGLDEFYQSTIVSLMLVQFFLLSHCFVFQTIGRQQMQDFAENLVKNPPKKLHNGENIERLGKLHYLHRTRVDIDDITLLGCTLWRGWKEDSNHARRLASATYRPIKDFYAEEEKLERDLDMIWLQSQLEACANGRPTSPASEKDSTVPPEQSSTMDEGDIYDDVEMSPPGDSLGSQIFKDAPSTGKTPLESSGSESVITSSSPKYQGPPRRVVILTAQPPTFKRTAILGIGPPKGEQTEEAVVLLKDRQCWALDDAHGAGVIVNSPLNGNDEPRLQQVDSAQIKVEKMDTDVHQVQPCGHGGGSTQDPYRPPGVALWAFGYTGWSCDTNYKVRATMTPDSDQKGKKLEVPAGGSSGYSRCSQCNRASAPIRLLSNQRGHQWERNPVPYVDVPPIWRAFDEALVADV